MPESRLMSQPATVVCLALVALAFAFAGRAHPAYGQPAQVPATPEFAQPGQDVVWVPTPPETLTLMLDLARVTADDYVIDLGSGDGRTVIAAAKRGARALGVEYNPDLVALSTYEANRAGVGDRARFVQGDMYEADVSKADVLALFLLTENLRTLTPTFLALRPGTRIVSNTFAIPGWTPEATAERQDGCHAWCTALLYLVPAQVGGHWTLPGAQLHLEQQAQTVSGTLVTRSDTHTLTDVTIRGASLAFVADGVRYTGTVSGDTIDGTMTSGGTSQAARWRATRVSVAPDAPPRQQP